MVKRILLAEDDEDDQYFFRNFLDTRDDVRLAFIVENGVLLIDWLEAVGPDSDLPDLIILDQNMPKKNGLQTLEYLKASGRYRHIPTLIYSTYTDEALVKNGLKGGACMVAQKPITKEGYDEMIDSAFQFCR